MPPPEHKDALGCPPFLWMGGRQKEETVPRRHPAGAQTLQQVRRVFSWQRGPEDMRGAQRHSVWVLPADWTALVSSAPVTSQDGQELDTVFFAPCPLSAHPPHVSSVCAKLGPRPWGARLQVPG